MLDLETHTRRAPAGFLVRIGQGLALVCPLVGEVFRPRRDVLVQCVFAFWTLRSNFVMATQLGQTCLSAEFALAT